ncbi:MAG: lysostaphin resistance A-like protein [Mycobacterium leprae]
MEASTFWKRGGKLRPTGRVLIFAGLVVGLFFVLDIGSGIVIGVLAVLKQRPALMDILKNVLFNEAIMALVAIGATLLACLIERRRLGSLGLGYAGGRFLWGSLVGAGMQSLVLLLALVTAGYAFAWNGSHVAASPWFQYVAAMLLTGFAEESLFRGYLLRTLEEGWGRRVALAVTSILFALAHFANPGFTLQAFIGLCLIGLFFGYSVYATGTLWFAIGVHAFWNIFEGVVYGFPNSGNPEPYSILQAVAHGPVWWTGGRFGPEAGLISLLVQIAGLWLLVRYARRQAPALA